MKVLNGLVALALLVMQFVSLNSFAQQLKVVTGTVQDTTGLTLPSALVKLSSSMESLSAATDVDGHFKFANVKDSLINISVNYIGYKPFQKQVKLNKHSSIVK